MVGTSRRGKFHTALIISYIIVLVLPVLVSVFSFRISRNLLREEMQKSTSALLTQVNASMDRMIADVESLSYQISNSDSLQTVLLYPGPELSPAQIFQVSQLAKDMRFFRSANNSLMEGVYLYVRGIERIVSPDGMYEPEMYHRLRLGGEGISYEGWHDALDGEDAPRVLSEGDRLIYRCPLSSSRSKHAGSITVSLRKSRLLEAIRDIQWLKGNVNIVMDQGGVIAATAQADLSGLPAYEDLPAETSVELIATRVGGLDYMVFCTSSPKAHWKYLVMIPTAQLQGRVVHLTRVFWICAAVSAVLGCALAVYFSRWNARSVGNMERQLIQQERELRAGFVARLLRGELDPAVPLLDTMARFGAEGDAYQVAILYWNEYAAPVTDQEIEALLELTLGSERFVSVCPVNGFMTILMTVDQPDDPAAAAALIDLREQLLARKRDRCCLLVSASHPLSELPNAYLEAADLLSQHIVADFDGIVYHRDAPPRAVRNHYFYPPESENKILLLLKQGKADELRGTLAFVLEQNAPNFTGGQSLLPYARCLLADAAATAVKALQELGMEPRELVPEFDIASELLGCGSPEALMDLMLVLCGRIDVHLRERGEASLPLLCLKVVQHIEAHYQDCNLSVYGAAEALGVSPAHLSRIFKEGMNVTLSSYIAGVRVDRAKRLFAQMDSLQDVMLATGFSNMNTFIRTFKKLEGITPGQYKDSIGRA